MEKIWTETFPTYSKEAKTMEILNRKRTQSLDGWTKDSLFYLPHSTEEL